MVRVCGLASGLTALHMTEVCSVWQGTKAAAAWPVLAG